MSLLKVIMIGDVVGDPGLEVLENSLPSLIEQSDFVMVNGENSADGFGLSEQSLERILKAGADVVSSGNHVWEKRDFWPILDTEKRILRPANYSDGPGQGWIRIHKEIRGQEYIFIAINLQGRELMHLIDCPFRCFDKIYLDESGQNSISHKTLILVDFHAESSREKEAFAFYLDGRASVVAGTHTHVQTADEKILPKGTAYISDLGMTGVSGAVIGMEPKICIDRARNQVLYRMEAAASSGSQDRRSLIQGISVELDSESGKALDIKRINLPSVL